MGPAPRILVVRFSALGDCVMAAWAATAIRTAFPSAYLAWAVESRCQALIERERLASCVIEVPRDRWKRSRWSPKTWRQQLSVYLGLRRHHFEVGIDLQGHAKTALLLRLSGATKRIAVRATDPFAARLNPLVKAPHPQHTVERAHQAVETLLGRLSLPERPLMPCCPEHERFVRTLLPSEGPVVTIAVSAGSLEKAYPIEQWREVARALIQQGTSVAFLGGFGDPHPDVPGATDLVGKFPIEMTLEAVRVSAVHLAADTGTGHIAAALGVPVVSVFGPTNPEEFRPFTPKATVLKHSPQVSQVPPSQIVEAALTWLNANAS